MTPMKGMSMHSARKHLVGLALGAFALGGALAFAVPSASADDQPIPTYLVFAQSREVELLGSNNPGSYVLDPNVSVQDAIGTKIDTVLADENATDNPCTRKLVASYEDNDKVYAPSHAELLVTFTGGTCTPEPTVTDEPTSTPTETVTDEPTDTPTVTVTSEPTETATATSTPECTCPTPCADEAACHACQVTVNNWVAVGTAAPAGQSSTRTAVVAGSTGAPDFTG